MKQEFLITKGFRSLTDGEVSCVAGGYDEPNTVDPYTMQYLDNVMLSSPSLGYAGFQSLGCIMGTDGTILPVDTLWEAAEALWAKFIPTSVIDIDGSAGGHTLVTWSNGQHQLYINGVYAYDVRITSITATNGSPTFSIQFGQSGGFSYGANDNYTYTFEPINK